MELSQGSIVIKAKKSNAVIRTASAVGCTVNELKTARKGHAYAFRLDMLTKDSKGEDKYVLAVASLEEKAAWMRALTACSHAEASGGK